MSLAAVPSSNTHPVTDFLEAFNRLDTDNLHRLEAMYTDDVVFTDPFHTVVGRDALRDYLGSLYKRLEACEFTYESVITQGDASNVTWVMRYRHPRINAGREITVHGCSHLKLRDSRVCMHRDYFDAGEMIYQHLPIVGSLIRFVHARMS